VKIFLKIWGVFEYFYDKLRRKKFRPTMSLYGFDRARETAQDTLKEEFKKDAHSALIRSTKWRKITIFEYFYMILREMYRTLTSHIFKFIKRYIPLDAELKTASFSSGLKSFCELFFSAKICLGYPQGWLKK